MNGEQFWHEDEVKADGHWWVHFFSEKFPENVKYQPVGKRSLGRSLTQWKCSVL
jgi:hypothetical protein